MRTQALEALKPLKSIKSAAYIIECFFAVVALRIDLNPDIDFLQAVKSVQATDALFFVALFLLSAYRPKPNTKRVVIIALAFAIIVGLIFAIGWALETTDGLNALYAPRYQIIKLGIYFVGSSVISYIIASTLMSLILARANGGRTADNRTVATAEPKKPWYCKKRILALAWILMFCCWLPWFLIYYPGLLTPDSVLQVFQAAYWEFDTTETITLINHHPIAHTMLIRLCLYLADTITGNTLDGIAYYSLLQMLVMSGIFTFAAHKVGQLMRSNKAMVGVWLFFAVLPINSAYSITMWKDVLFGGFILLLTIALIDLIIHKKSGAPTKEFFKHKANLPLLVISMLGVMLFKNNGIYIALITALVLIICFKGLRWRILAITAVCSLLFFGVYKVLIFNQLNVMEGAAREMMSVPAQQFAAVIKDHADDLPKQDKILLAGLFSTSQDQLVEVGSSYKPRLADPVKDRIDQNYLLEHKLELVQLYLGYWQKYPALSTKTLLLGNYGYWYPNTEYWVASGKSNQITFKSSPDYVYYDINNLPSYVDNRYIAIYGSAAPNVASFDYPVSFADIINQLRRLPLINGFFSIGAYFLVFLFCAFTIIARMEKLALLALMPVFVLWLTCLASPVYAEFRYIYGLVVAIPTIIAFAAQKTYTQKTHL